MAFLRAHLKKLVTGPTGGYVAPLPTNQIVPTVSGAAITAGTLTAARGTWTASPTAYESVWQVADGPAFTNWTDISGANALTYVVQSGLVGKKLRYGERALSQGKWSAWAYSAPTGIVAAIIAALPVISTPASAAPASGLKVGDTITLTAASYSGTGTTAFYSFVVDGVQREAVATDQSTFPFNYILQPGDVCNSFIVRTTVQNAAGTVTADFADIGPVQINGATAIINLGSAQATEDYLISSFNSGLWIPSGTATQSVTVASPDALAALWPTIAAAPLTERWDVTLDWNGMANYQGGETSILTLNGPAGAIIPNYGPSGWADNGGWVRFKAAAGKRPGFANLVTVTNARGLIIDGLDFLGKGTSHSQGCLRISRSTGQSDCIARIYNSRFGRYCIDNTMTYPTYITGLYLVNTQDQIHVENCTFAGNNIAFKAVARKVKIVNCDFSQNYTDLIRCYTHDRTGYYAHLWLDRTTVRTMLEIPEIAGLHADFVQNGNHPSASQSGDSAIEGHRIIATDCIVHMTHKYGSQGTQGLQCGGGNPAVPLDNLFSFRRCIILNSSPGSFDAFSPGARITSYIERCTFGRSGVVSSTFDTDTVNSDNTPGINIGGNPLRTGTAFIFDSCIIGMKPGTNPAWITYINTVVINYKTSMTGILPETVYNGRDFQRGGASSDFTPNKFGYILPNESTQAGFISDIIANFTPQGAYANQGAPAPVLANYTAPALG
jgi:hypothetical protein